MIGADPQIEFWMTVGLILLVAAVFLAMFKLWPTGGDPRRGGDHYPPTDGSQ